MINKLFQSPDGDFVYSDVGEPPNSQTVSHRFQSPDGDFVYSDKSPNTSRWNNHGYLFQSPDGDFVYSDTFGSLWRQSTGTVFQSPDGDFVYSDFQTIHQCSLST